MLYFTHDNREYRVMLYFTHEVFFSLANQIHGHVRAMLEYVFLRFTDVKIYSF